MLENGTIVTVIGPSVAAGGRLWVPVETLKLGAGWIAGSYLTVAAAATITPMPASPAATQTPGGASPTRTATRPPGGFIAGDRVRTTAKVNLRSAPGTSSSVLAVLPKSAYGTVTGDPISSGGMRFYPVSFDGYASGYVVSTYLQRVTSTPAPTRTSSPTPTVAGNLARWTTGDVNMRSGPGTGYRVVAKLPKGARVAVIGAPRRAGGYDWYPVEVNGTGTGWIAGKFLSITPPL